MVFKLRNSNIVNTMRLEQKILKKFIQRAQTLAIAESCTGGLIGDRLTNRQARQHSFCWELWLMIMRLKQKYWEFPLPS